MELHRAGEDYLKAILILQKQNHAVRSLDVAEMLSVTKPSVSRAMKLLEKHRVLTECLVTMGVDPGIAEKDACRMEHLISPETLEQMKIYVGRELAV